MPAAGGGGALPAGFAGGGGALPAGGFAGAGFPAGAGLAGAGLPAGAGFPAGAGLPAGAGFAADLAALGSGLASVFGAYWAGVGAGVSFTFFCLPKSSTVSFGRVLVTIPAAIVLPPSLKANREPSMMVIGKCNFALTVRLSPGFAILIPSGRAIYAAVSAVL